MEVLSDHIAKMSHFVEHPHIRPLATRDAWSISTYDKMPIDIYALETYDTIVGCNIEKPYSTRTLDELHELLPDAANYAFYLDARIDNVCILDIEPDCSDELKAAFLEMDCLYAETSMSGKGYHLLIPYPQDILAKYPIAAKKSVLKNKKKGFELLFNHWVTFTGNQIKTNPTAKGNQIFAEELDSLASIQREFTHMRIDLGESHPDDIFGEKDILHAVMTNKRELLNRTPEDYDNDLSRYEFAICIRILKYIRRAQENLRQTYGDIAQWDDQQTAWLIFAVAHDILDYREKHDELRSGMPYLLYIIGNAIALEAAEKSKQ